MFRLLGYLVGSVSALTIILMVLGIPDLHLSDAESNQDRFDAAVKKLKQKQQDVAQAADTVADELVEKASVEEEVQERNEQPVPAVHEELQWYSFWNPFRSEIAARGFVSRLEKVTGLDYRIVKVKTGVYEVAFAYGNDTERRSKLSQISAATGLDLPES